MVPRHGLTEPRLYFTADDHYNGQGLLDIVDKEQVKLFRGNSYCVSTPADDIVQLYRLHEPGNDDVGHARYWSPMAPNSGRTDGPNYTTWNGGCHDVEYCGSADNILLVPRGVLLYEGYSSTTSENSKENTTWKIFIPNSVVTPLLRYQRELVSGQLTNVRGKLFMEKVNKLQAHQITNWTENYLRNIVSRQQFDISHLMVIGNNIPSLPQEIQNVLPNFQSGIVKTRTRLVSGRYVVHDETLRLPDGSTFRISLLLTLEEASAFDSPFVYRVGYEWDG